MQGLKEYQNLDEHVTLFNKKTDPKSKLSSFLTSTLVPGNAMLWARQRHINIYIQGVTFVDTMYNQA